MTEQRADRLTRFAGLAFTVVYAALIGWLFARQPQTVAQITGGLAATIGAYNVDAQAFDDGLRFFRNDQFVEARMAFARADPAVRDARTQFYIAYSYYRQGWGRLYTTMRCTPRARRPSTARSRSRQADDSSSTTRTCGCAPARS